MNFQLNNYKKGFTLVELLIVISIIAILVTVGLVSFRTSQARGRDAQRKSDLKQIANSLELFYSDYNKYPNSSGGYIGGCPSTNFTSCDWGVGEFTDGKNIYFKVMPKDPATGYSYYYRIVDTPANQKYQLFARLENTQDNSCIGGDCANSPVTFFCNGAIKCNFAVTSTNTKATE